MADTHTKMYYQQSDGNSIKSMSYQQQSVSYPSQGLIVKSDLESKGVCVLLDVGGACPSCSGKFRAKIISSQAKLSVSRRGQPQQQHKQLTSSGHQQPFAPAGYVESTTRRYEQPQYGAQPPHHNAQHAPHHTGQHAPHHTAQHAPHHTAQHAPHHTTQHAPHHTAPHHRPGAVNLVPHPGDSVYTPEELQRMGYYQPQIQQFPANAKHSSKHHSSSKRKHHPPQKVHPDVQEPPPYGQIFQGTP